MKNLIQCYLVGALFIVCVRETLCDVYIMINVRYVVDKSPAELEGFVCIHGISLQPGAGCYYCKLLVVFWN